MRWRRWRRRPRCVIVVELDSDEMVEAAEAAVMAAETAKTALSDAWAAYEVAPSEAGATAITDAAAALVAAAAVLGEAAVDDDQTAAVEGFNAYAALVGAVLDNAGRAVASVEMAAMLAAAEAARLAQEDLDAAKADVTRLEGELAAAPTDADVAAVQTMLDAAKADVTRLEGELAAAPTDADVAAVQTMLDAAKADVTRLEGELAAAPTDADVPAVQTMLDAAKADVTRLEGELATAQGMATTNAGEVTRLEGELATAQGMATTNAGEVTRLEGELATAQGMATTNAGEVTRLEGELATAQGMATTNAGEVTRLEGELATAQGMATTNAGEVTRLEGELATAQGMATTNAGEVTRLEGELATAQGMATTNAGEVTRLEGELATAQGMATTNANEVTRLEGELATANARADAAETMANAFATAYHARTNAGAAAETAAEAVTDATAASGEITTQASGVAGDSAVAEANAQAVLNNRDAANNAVTTARNAKQSAESALSGATDATLIVALEEAIKVADENLKAATMSAEGDTLKAAVELVTGTTDPEAEGYPKTPAQHGEGVAMAIGGALMPTSTSDGAGMRVPVLADAAPDAMGFPDAFNMDNHVGSTWAKIVGAGNIMKMRIATATDDTDEVDAASIADQPLSYVTVGAGLAGMNLEDGAQHDGNYKGIPGTVFCSGDDCAVGATTLTGSWFFTPMYPMEWYVRTAADTGYEAETLYARFGHWLTANVEDPALTDINTYAMGGAGTGTNTGSLVLTVKTEEGATSLTDTSATYNGPAAGMSLHKEFDGQGAIVPGSLQSAAFTADVKLTVTFGSAPTLGGTVSNFQGGATDPDWSVVLLNRGFVGSFDSDDAGTTTASGQDGEWTAQAFGPIDGRPTGVFGGFNAHFSDGHAAGAYATRK